MKTLVCFVEGDADELLVRSLFSQIVSSDAATLQVIRFRGKQDLEKRLTDRLRGWLIPESRFLVVRDQDAEDCRKLKVRILGLVQASGKSVASSRVRIACHEIESFYLGDLAAVEKGLGLKGLATQQKKARYRDPDHALANAKQELKRLTRNLYQKISGTRLIAPYLLLDGSNYSRSFNALVSAIRDLALSR